MEIIIIICKELNLDIELHSREDLGVYPRVRMGEFLRINNTLKGFQGENDTIDDELDVWVKVVYVCHQSTGAAVYTKLLCAAAKDEEVAALIELDPSYEH